MDDKIEQTRYILSSTFIISNKISMFCKKKFLVLNEVTFIFIEQGV